MITWKHEGNLDVLRFEPDGNNTFDLDFIRDDILKRLRRGNRVVWDMDGVELFSTQNVQTVLECGRLAKQKAGLFVLINTPSHIHEKLEQASIFGSVPFRFSLQDIEEELANCDKTVNAMERLAAGNARVIRPSQEVKLDRFRNPRTVADRRRKKGPQLEDEIDEATPSEEHTPITSVIDRAAAQRLAEDKKRATVRKKEEEESTPWKRALKIYKAANELAKEQGMEFDSKMTFQDFLMKMSRSDK